MKILVLNGSPKGKYSITVHTLLFLEELYKEHEFKYLNIGQQIKSLEKDMSHANELINEADLIIFAYPIYTFIAPSQVHRFIELLKEQNLDLSNKFVTQITTSKHFYDMTAHKYIEDNCFDLNMKVIHGLSLDMEDLTTEKGQTDTKNFFNFVIYSKENNIYETKPLINYKEEKEYLLPFACVLPGNCAHRGFLFLGNQGAFFRRCKRHLLRTGSKAS